MLPPNRLVISFPILCRLLLPSWETSILHANCDHTSYFAADSDIQELQVRIGRLKAQAETARLVEQSLEALLELIQIIPDNELPRIKGFPCGSFSVEVARFLNIPLWMDEQLPRDVRSSGVEYWSTSGTKHQKTDQWEANEPS